MAYVLPYYLKGLTVYPKYGKIVLDENMSNEELLEAKKLYPEIVIVEEKKTKKKGFK